jgi:predicted phage tail protein
MKNLVKIKLHGHLGKTMKKRVWNLSVETVFEAINAINVLSNNKLKKRLIKDHRENIKYNVLIDGRDFMHEDPLDIKEPETIKSSELCLKNNKMKTIDLIPIIEGAGDGINIFTIILAIVLIVWGFVIAAAGNPQLGYAMVMAGLGLLAAGISNLIAKSPKPGEISDSIGSYMFNGPQNTDKEGNPVPIGYGRLLVGSQIISASYDIDYLSSEAADRPILTV